MRKLFAFVAGLLGWKTWYHVAAQYPSDGSLVTVDLVVSIKPWLRIGDNLEQLREHIKSQAAYHGCKTTPSIISITRIGA